MYNGRDGVVTDDNGLVYMRARYYSPELRRFVNADVLVGDIADSTSLNRYSYVNGDPVSFIDPMGLEKSRENSSLEEMPNIIATAYIQAMLFEYFKYKTIESAKAKIKKVTDSIVSGVQWVISKTSSWDEKMEEFFKTWKNKDGEISLIDNNRRGEINYIKRKKGYIFHEQFFVLDDTPEFLNLENGTFSIVSFDFTLAKGKWVTKNGTEIALLDFGRISFDIEIDPNKKTYVNFNSGIQIWNPSITFDVNGRDVTIDYNAGGGETPTFKVSEDKINIGIGIIGIGIER